MKRVIHAKLDLSPRALRSKILSLFSDLVDLGLQVDGDRTASKDGQDVVIVQFRVDDNILKAKFVSHDDKVDAYFKKPQGSKTIHRADIDPDDLDEAILDAIKELYGLDAKDFKIEKTSNKDKGLTFSTNI